MSVFAIAISIVCLSLFCSQVFLMWRKQRMLSNDQKLRADGIFPYGSGVCHGMVLSRDKMSVIKDQKNTPAWYSRLD